MTVSGAFSLLTLHDKDGKEHNFRICPLDDRDFDSLDLWLRREYTSNALSSIPQDIDERTRDSLHRAVMNEAASLRWLTPKGASMLCTIKGIAYMTWLALKSEHPNVELSWLTTLLSSHANLEAARIANNETRPTLNEKELGSKATGKKPQRNKFTGRSRKGTATRRRK